MSLIPYKISSSWGNGFEIVGGVWQTPLVKGVGTKRLGKGRVKLFWMIPYLPLLTTTTTIPLHKFFTVTLTPSTAPVVKHTKIENKRKTRLS